MRNLENYEYQKTFSDYKKVIFNLIQDLSQLKDISKEINLDENSINLIESSINRISNDKFSIAVVGDFRKGKSSFINALIGREILPSDVLPTTAALNRVTYGITPKVNIIFKDPNKSPEEIELDKLSHYVTKLDEESEKNSLSIKEAIIYYPLAFCQNNVDIIDTPGLNDEANMSEITYSILSQVDVAIFMIASNHPFSESEKNFLEDKLLTSDLSRIIFLVNLWSDLSESDAEKILENIKKRIQNMVLKKIENQHHIKSENFEKYKEKIGSPKVFGVYVKKALHSRISHDLEELKKTRLTFFENSLERLLTLEGGIIRLYPPINRVISSSKEILRKIDMIENTLKMQQDDFRIAYKKGIEEIDSLRKMTFNELKLIDAASLETINILKPSINQLLNKIKNELDQIIENHQISSNDLKNKKLLTEKLSNEVKIHIDKVITQFIDNTQDTIQKAIDKEVSRLKHFINKFDSSINVIENQFININVSDYRKNSSVGETISVALAFYTGLGGIWSGYKVAGIKGAAVGVGISSAAILTAGFGIGVIGAPITLPVLIAVTLATGIGSYFISKSATESIWSKDRIKQFKSNFNDKAWEKIEADWHNQGLEQKIYDYIIFAFGNVKTTLQQEADNTLDNTQKTLNELNDKYGRNEATSESEIEHYTAIRQKTLTILGNAQGLRSHLSEISSV